MALLQLLMWLLPNDCSQSMQLSLLICEHLGYSRVKLLLALRLMGQHRVRLLLPLDVLCLLSVGRCVLCTTLELHLLLLWLIGQQRVRLMLPPHVLCLLIEVKSSFRSCMILCLLTLAT